MESSEPYWLTRDSNDEGELSIQVDVWSEPPELHRLPGGGSMWLGKDDCGVETRTAIWSLDETLKACRVLPETYREIIRVG